MGKTDKTMPINSANDEKSRPATPILALPLIAIIRCYQLILSPVLGQNCRFYPTCSCYAQEALKKHGLAKGSMLAIKRIVKCHPMHPGGIDTVPERKQKN